MTMPFKEEHSFEPTRYACRAQELKVAEKVF